MKLDCWLEVEELEEEEEGVQETQAYLFSRLELERMKSRKMSPNIPVCERKPFR